MPVALLEGSFSEKLSKAALFGFQGVEIMITDPSHIDVSNLKMELKSLHISVAAISTGAMASIQGLTLIAKDNSVMLESHRRLLELIAFAHELSAPVVTIGSFRGRMASIGTIDEGIGKLKEILSQAGGEAEALGVSLAIEPINRYEADFLHTAEETTQFINEIGGGGIGLLLDTFHMNIEEISLVECFRSILKQQQLVHVHLGDSNRLVPGRGHIEFGSIFDMLNEFKYEGFVSAELYAKPSADLAAKETIEAIRRFTNNFSPTSV